MSKTGVRTDPPPEKWLGWWNRADAVIKDLDAVHMANPTQRQKTRTRILAESLQEVASEAQVMARAELEAAGRATGITTVEVKNRMFWSRVIIRRAEPVVQRLRYLLPLPSLEPWPGPRLNLQLLGQLLRNDYGDEPSPFAAFAQALDSSPIRSALAVAMLSYCYPGEYRHLLTQDPQDLHWWQPQPPFSSWREARTWLFRAACTQLPWSGLGFHNSIFEEPILQVPFEPSVYPTMSFMTRQFEGMTPTLGHVEGLVRLLVEETGWDKRQAVAHLLAGVNPLIGPPRVRRDTRIPRAELAVFPGLTATTDFNQTMREVQAAWGATDLWLLELTETESAFLEAMLPFGPPPAKSGPGRGSGRWQYWRNVAVSLGWDEHKGPDNARKRWDRMVQKWPQVEDYVKTGKVGGEAHEADEQA